MKIQGISVVVALSAGLLSAHCAVASVTVDVTERPLYTEAGNQSEPRISGDSIVFTDLGGASADIFVGDVNSPGSIYNLTNTATRDEKLNDVHGNLVVYTDVTGIGGGDIVGIDVTAPSTPALLIAGPANESRPKVTGNYVVYQYFNGSDFDVNVYEISSGAIFTIAGGAGNQYDPAVSGTRVVFTDLKDASNPVVWSCDIATLSCSAVGPGQDADVDGDRIVYAHSDASGDFDVFLYTVGDSSLPVNLTNRAGDQMRPTISGNYVSFDDDSAGNWDVYLYLLDEEVAVQLTSNAADQKLAHVADGHVVYEDDRNAETSGVDIYVTDFTVRTGVLSCDPATLDFGDVALADSSQLIVTCSDTLGGRYLDGAVVQNSPASGFTPTVDVGLPYLFPQGGSVDVTVTFIPVVEALHSDLLIINGRDELLAGHTAYWYELVALQGNGVIVEPPPSERIQAILDFFDSKWASGELIGNGPGTSAVNRAYALRNMIEAAGDQLAGGELALVCEQLMDAYRRTDGATPPPDFVDGDAAAELASMIYELWTDIGCSG